MKKVVDTCVKLLRVTPLKVFWLLALINLPLRWLAVDIFLASYMFCWPLAFAYSISCLYPETTKRRATWWLATPPMLYLCLLLVYVFLPSQIGIVAEALGPVIVVIVFTAYFVGLWKVASVLVSLEENSGTPPRDTLSTFFALFYHFLGGSVWINARAHAVNPEI